MLSLLCVAVQGPVVLELVDHSPDETQHTYSPRRVDQLPTADATNLPKMTTTLARLQ